MKSISLYVDQDTFLSRMHPFTKLVYILAIILIPLLSGHLALFGVMIAISLLLLISGQVIKKTVPLIAFSFTIIITVFIIQGLFDHNNTNVLFSIGFLHFYKEGLLYALRIGLNILNMLLGFAVFVLTTKPNDLVEDLEQIGFSPRFGYMISSVFQIVPQMSGTMKTITDAQRSRGLETEGSLWTRMKSFIPLISPVVMNSLIDTRERAIALEVRGFNASGKKTYLREHKMQTSDKMICLILVIGMILSLVSRFL